MSQQNLQEGQRRDFGEAPDRTRSQVVDELGGLFETSPARRVHTSAAAEIAFLASLASLLAVPFPLTMALSLGLAAVGLVLSVVGLARAHRPDTAGTLLASMGLVLALATLALVGVRYADIDTTFDASVVSTLGDWLTSLNDLVPAP